MFDSELVLKERWEAFNVGTAVASVSMTRRFVSTLWPENTPAATKTLSTLESLPVPPGSLESR